MSPKQTLPGWMLWPLAAILMGVAGCSTPFGIDNNPRALVGDANEITIRARGWYAPDPVAETHCQQYAKRAVYAGFTRVEERSDLKLHYYRCEDLRQE